MTEEITDWDKLQLEAAEAALKSKQALLDYVLQGEGYADLIAACDEALNWADANARWFDISTAPKDGTLVMFHVPSRTNPLIGRADDYWAGAYWLADVTHWAPLPPPPSNPQLPEPLEALGAVLRKVKGTT